MADVLLRSGAIIVCDDEDLEYVASFTWRRWSNGRYIMAARDEDKYGRRYRVLLHREIALRVWPVDKPQLMKVSALNEDFLDVRRENLSIHVRTKPGRPKIEPRPLGYRRYATFKASDAGKDVSALWAGGLVPVRVDRTRNCKVLVPGGR